MCPNGYPIKDAENWQSAFLPGAYQGTYIDSAHTEIDKLIANIRNSRLTGKQQRNSSICCKPSTENMPKPPERRPARRPHPFVRVAYRMQMEATDAFDITRNPSTSSTCTARGPTLANYSSLAASSNGACASSSCGTARANPGTITTTSP